MTVESKYVDGKTPAAPMRIPDVWMLEENYIIIPDKELHEFYREHLESPCINCLVRSMCVYTVFDYYDDMYVEVVRPNVKINYCENFIKYLYYEDWELE